MFYNIITKKYIFYELLSLLITIPITTRSEQTEDIVRFLNPYLDTKREEKVTYHQKLLDRKTKKKNEIPSIQGYTPHTPLP